MSNDNPTIQSPPNPWARISEVAAKLGVEPATDRTQATILATGADGQQYDLWEVVSRFIDRLNAPQ
jgi:hypothetical protein